MKYTIERNNFNDFSVYEINKRPGRAYMIPYSSKNILSKTPFAKERTSSDLVRVLSGEWDFKYFDSNKNLPDVIDTNKTDFDKIKVPCTWQRTGYDSPAYINCPYAFDDAPPYVPFEQPVAIYRKKFEIESKNGNYIIAFLGVVSCLDLYINGKFIGYSEGAHNTAEFDITSNVKKGENEIFAVVHKWSNGTFLECQDMFRENGIFRDVLLYEMPKTFVNDIYYKPSETSKGWDLDAFFEIENSKKDYFAKVEIYDGKKLIAEKIADASENKISFKSLKIQSWNAEIPKLYTAYFTLFNGENEIMSVRNYIGFKTVKIKKDVFTVNGKAIKIKGVNHHDTHYTKGYAMGFEDMKKDIELMKSLNVNAVRTSHYPPDPQFLILCDIYGLYVVDEADIETHGCGNAPHNNINLLSHDPEWGPRYLDRVKRMYLRDRSRAGIILWSLGNEAGGYCNQDLCYDFLHKENPEIPIHYEGVIATERHSYDVVSEMYTNHELVEKCGKHTRGKKYTPKPFFLCEYAHAMGEGPGGLEEYWNIFYKYQNLMGGCIWEWADHSYYNPRAKYKYTYGGDHGEWRHDGCFCVDGLMYPDRRLHTGAKEMKNVYRPVRASYSNNEITFFNTNRFRNTSYITAVFEVVKNGNILLSAEEAVLDIEPECSRNFPVNFKKPKDKCDIHINVYYYDGEKEIAFEQIALEENYKVQIESANDKLKLTETKSSYNIELSNGSISISKADGQISSYVINGKEFINQYPAISKGFIPNIYRAVTDNDVRLVDGWKEAGYSDYICKLKNVEAVKSGKNIKITVNYNLSSKIAGKTIAKSAIEYIIKPNGVISVNTLFNPSYKKNIAKNLPRFGLTVEMPESFNNIEYYGMGPEENLTDYYAQSIIGIYETTVEEMYEPYIRPQEHGNRCRVRYVKVTDSDGVGLEFAYKDNYFSFNARKFTQKLLDNANHIEDLHNEHTTVVNIDGFTRGAGTQSCGPDVLDKYLIDGSKGLEFSFSIIPIENK